MSKTIRTKIWEVSRSLPVFEKESQGFKFKYVNLEQIVGALIPLLKEQGLIYYHTTGQEGFVGNSLTTTVEDVASGEKVEVSLLLPDGVKLAGMNDYQVLGSGLTYYRRYNLVTIFDILGAEEDADANTKSRTYKVDYIKKCKELIASGKYARPQMEGWFNKERGLMTDEQRVECKGLVQKMKTK